MRKTPKISEIPIYFSPKSSNGTNFYVLEIREKDLNFYPRKPKIRIDLNQTRVDDT